jgi:DNA-binding winged helix-turn-helix (wHTH) protein
MDFYRGYGERNLSFTIMDKESAMVFEIDKRVIYRAEDGAIWPLGDEGSTIILTLTMNRLLACLLEKRGQVITRNELLDNVWDAYGLRSSSHTLNKYISELRKYFTQFGIVEECITTVPRVGFMFNSDVDVNVITDSTSTNEPVLESHNDDKPEAGHRKRIASKYRFAPAACVMLALLTSATLIIMGSGIPSKDPGQIKDLKTYFLFDYETCPVYTIQKNSVSFSEEKKELFLQLTRERKLECLAGTSFLYQVSESYLYGSKGRAFISRCTEKDNRYISCLNNYWNGYERN